MKNSLLKQTNKFIIVLILSVVLFLLLISNSFAIDNYYTAEKFNDDTIKITLNDRSQVSTDEAISRAKKITAKHIGYNNLSNNELLSFYDNLQNSDYVLLQSTAYQVDNDENGDSIINKVSEGEIAKEFLSRSSQWNSPNKYVRITTQISRRSDLDRNNRKAILVSSVVDWLKHFSTWDRYDYIGIAWTSDALIDVDSYAPNGKYETVASKLVSYTGPTIYFSRTSDASISYKLNAAIFKLLVKNHDGYPWISTSLNANILLQIKDDINLRTTFAHDQGVFPASSNLETKISFSGITMNIPTTTVKKYEADPVYVEYNLL